MKTLLAAALALGTVAAAEPPQNSTAPLGGLAGLLGGGLPNVGAASAGNARGCSAIASRTTCSRAPAPPPCWAS